MKGSLKLVQIAGIGIFVHWTFAILLAWVGMLYLVAGKGDVGVMLQGIVFLLAIFGCVVLHELGHALTARRFGIGTRDITLLPIGGLARLERMPEEPKQELLIALAGPAVNVVIAGVLFFGMQFAGGVGSLLEFHPTTGSFLANLMTVNVMLVLFNLLPAFPMDGGRVLRALLATRLPYLKATQIAASIGQAMAIGFGILGLFVNLWLLVIALFIYMAGQAEAQMVHAKAAFHGFPVHEAMTKYVTTMSPAEPLEAAVDALIAGHQQDFPVVQDGRVVGLLTRTDLIRALSEGGAFRPVGDVMRHDCAVVEESESLETAFTRMAETNCPALSVVSGGKLVGLLTTENVSEWVMIRTALGNGPGSGRPHSDQPSIGSWGSPTHSVT